ncbi:MAG: hybrid sensor histidine kinase/response regulator, partial [Phocaeicola dorei]|nr:hybrid sensor histidine kinase/response regulator [Phocaeicola dorei]
MLREITNFVRILPPNNMRRILLLICLFVILVTPAVAQLYQYLDTQNGLSSRRVLSIRKDKKGYMWFLTHEGIDRYNGKQYTHYSLTANGKLLNFFPNLNTLQIDTAGVVWEIGKTGHLFKYNSLQDKFELVCDFASKDKSNSGLPLTASFLDSKDNNILLCTKNKQYLFDIDTHELIQLESPIKEEITYIAKSTNNQYFLASSHKIYCARLNHGRLEVIKHPELDNFHIVNYIYFHPETQMLVIGTLLDGIYLYNIHSRQLIDVHNGLQDINVNSIIASKENENEVLIATNGAGVYKLNLGTYELTNFLNADHNHSNKMNGNIINDIYIDDDQKLWMAVYPIGITVYSEKYPGYQWIQHSYDNPNSLIDNQVNYILEDSEGDIWYATNNGVCCYSPSTKQWTNLLSTYQHDTPNQNHVFISICESRPGVILVGGYMSGMYKIDKKNMTTQYFIPQTLNDDTVKPDKYIRCIYKDWDNLIWAGGYYNLKSYDLDTKEMHCYNMDFPITYITNKDAHNLWIGTINGLYQFNKVNQELKAVNLDSELGCINTIYQSKKNITFIGTHGSGMWIYNNYTEKVTNY